MMKWFVRALLSIYCIVFGLARAIDAEAAVLPPTASVVGDYRSEKRAPKKGCK